MSRKRRYSVKGAGNALKVTEEITTPKEEELVQSYNEDEVGYQDKLMTNVMRLHSKTWDAILCSDQRNDRALSEFNTDIAKLRKEFGCQICTELVSDEPLLPVSPNVRHGPVCKECLVKYNGCNCKNKECKCKLAISDFNDVPGFTLLIQSYKRFCFLYLRSPDCRKMLEVKVAGDTTFNAMGLIQVLKEGALKGTAGLRKSLIWATSYGGLANDFAYSSASLRQAYFYENVQKITLGATETESDKKPKVEIGMKTDLKPKSEPGFPSASSLCGTPIDFTDMKNVPTIKLPLNKKWIDGNKVFTYNGKNPPHFTKGTLEGSFFIRNDRLFSMTSSTSTNTTSTSTTLSNSCTPMVVLPSSSAGIAKTTQKGKESESPTHEKKIKTPLIKKDEHIKPLKGCRCGNAAANPGKLTCCGQRCPCYVDGKGCFDCKCKGCRNPHLPGGKKLLQGINAVIDTRTNETVPLQLPYITAQFFSNQNGQVIQPIFPLAASVASYNSYGIPVINVAPLVPHQLTQQHL